MRDDSVILIAEDDDRHFSLVQRGLELAGIHNQILRFVDGQQVLDSFIAKHEGAKQKEKRAYVLFLGIGIPKLDGVNVLERIKQNPTVKKMPVIMLTSKDDPQIIERCHNLGCSVYIVKPPDDESLAETVRKVGLFLSAVELPRVGVTE
jgi:CheY-like chemotaxis protein